MPKFQFEAISPQGKRVKGSIEAATSTDARSRLEAEGFDVRSISGGGSKNPAFMDAFGGVRQKDLQVFTRQMATLVASGVHLVQGLELMAGGTTSAVLRKCLNDVRDQVANGKSLYDAMSKYPKIFDKLYLNMVAAGEEGGVLDTVLNRLAGYIEKAVKLKGKVKAALWYPASIILVAGIVIMAIMVFVIPQFETMFKNAGQELPTLTVIVVGLSNFIISYWYLLAAAFGGAVVTLYRYLKSKDGRENFDHFVLKLPIFGPLVTNASVARFSRTLATLIASGVSIVEALEISANVTGNKAIEDVVLKSREAVTKGRTISSQFAQSALIPGMVSQMIAVGEQTGALDEMLNKVADFYESEVDTSVTAMTSIIEPVLMVVLGGIIAVLVIAMYLPIFNLAGVVGA